MKFSSPAAVQPHRVPHCSLEWSPGLPGCHQRTRGRGNPSAQQEHPPEPGVSPEASAAPTHHPSSPSWINFVGTETPDEIKHFQSLTSLGHTWILPRLQPWCKQALGLPWQPRAGLAAQWADLEQRIKKKGKKKSKAAKDFYYLLQHFTH